MLDGSTDFPWLNLITAQAPNLDIYHSTDAIEKAVAEMQCPGATKSIKNEGKIQVVSLSNPDAGGDAANKVKAFFIFGIHGREYIASETGLAFLQKLCDGSDASKALLTAVDFRIVPVMNPAGRMKVEIGASCSDQRKNGDNVDLNRNFDIQWNTGSTVKESEDYRGPGAFSEPESKLIRDIAKEFNPTVFVDVHSGARTMMIPYSFKAEFCKDDANMMQVIDTVVGEVFPQRPVKKGAAGATIGYTASGTTIDYVYEVLNIPYAFTYEIFSGSGNSLVSHAAAKDAVHLLASSTNSTGAKTSLTALQPEGVINLLSDGNECFQYFNPTSKELVETTRKDWADVMLATAKFFTTSKGQALMKSKN